MLLRLFSVLTLACALVFAETPPKDLEAKADEYLNAHVKLGSFSGSALIAKGDKILYAKGFALANRELDVPNAPNTKFRLGSITKQFTAAAVLQLEEASKLSVNDHACKFVDPCPDAWKEITIHHLLTHTAGIPNYTSFPEYKKSARETVTPTTLVARFKDKPLDFPPGSKMSYSNSGYALLGFIIEKASGETYEAYLKKHIFDPLDMQDTGFDHEKTILKNRASGYSGPLGKWTNADYLDMSIPYSAGSLYSTVLDLYHWDRALYTDKVLSKASREKMFTPVKNNYGYGFVISPDHKMISHGGGIDGFATVIDRYIADDAVVVVLGNHERSASGAIGMALLSIYLGNPYELPKERIAVPTKTSDLGKFVGKYQLPSATFTVEQRGDALWVTPNTSPAVELFAESPKDFFIKQADIRFEFQTENGKVSAMIVKQGGAPNQIAKRAE